MKLLHNIFPTNKVLHKIGVKESINCDFYSIETDFIIHYRWECPISKLFWKSFMCWRIHSNCRFFKIINGTSNGRYDYFLRICKLEYILLHNTFSSAKVFSFYIFTLLMFRKPNKTIINKINRYIFIATHPFDSRLYLDISRTFKGVFNLSQYHIQDMPTHIILQVFI